MLLVYFLYEIPYSVLANALFHFLHVATPPWSSSTPSPNPPHVLDCVSFGQ